MPEWYESAGKDSGVIVSSRVRMSRNLAGHRFPGFLALEEERAVQQKILEAFRRAGEDFVPLALENLKPFERRLLLEKKLISQDFALNSENILILNPQRDFSAMINTSDHLRMARLAPGLELRNLLVWLMELDDKLEENIDFAVDMDLGYLFSGLDNLGTGVGLSILAHLPALVKTGHIDKVLKAMLHADFQVRGFIGDSEDSLGQFFLIEARMLPGLSEWENLEKLEKLAEQINHYERLARQDLLNDPPELEDRIFRAVGLLNSCRLLEYNESVELISSLRLGTVMGILDHRLDVFNSLLILCQPCHIQERLLKKGKRTDEGAANQERAQLFRDFLIKEGSHV
ncbi:MAG: hypothetical protein LBQ61_05380 [Spirochaetales bacterium]|jgi:protein arginine kinase|nr:hypothetical protein [Spirochaetales bacterium]